MFPDDDDRQSAAPIDDGYDDEEDDLGDGQVDGADGEGDADLEGTADGNEEIDGEGTVAPQDDGQAVHLKKRNGAGETIRALRERAQRAELREAEERGRREGLERQRVERQTTESAEYERQRVALMTPDEKVDYYRQQDRQELDRRFGQMQFQQAVATDKMGFQALCTAKPAYAAVADEVEKRIADEHAKGNFVSREALAKYVIGERMVERGTRAAPKQRKAADARVAQQTARPVSARGDVTGTRTRNDNSREARAARLKDMKI